MIRRNSPIKQILLIEEEQFRNAGKYTEELMGVLRNRDDWIKDGVLSIDTSLNFTFNNRVVQAFNFQLRKLRQEGVISVKIKLDN